MCVCVPVSAGLKLQVASVYMSVHACARAWLPAFLPVSKNVHLSQIHTDCHIGMCMYVCLEIYKIHICVGLFLSTLAHLHL